MVDVPAGSLLGRVMRAQSRMVALDEHAAFVAAVDALVDAVHHQGWPVLSAASREAERLIGAAMLTDRSIRRLETSTGSAEKVMVVEAVAVSGLQVQRAVESLRAAGAGWVAAWVWDLDVNADLGDVDLAVCGSTAYAS